MTLWLSPMDGVPRRAPWSLLLESPGPIFLVCDGQGTIASEPHLRFGAATADHYLAAAFSENTNYSSILCYTAHEDNLVVLGPQVSYKLTSRISEPLSVAHMSPLQFSSGGSEDGSIGNPTNAEVRTTQASQCFNPIFLW
jgi:hypothetical protein